VIPEHPAQLAVKDVALDQVRQSYLRNALASLPEGAIPGEADLEYLAAETRTSRTYVEESIDELRGKTG
jgi:biotin operon repressor